MKKIGILIIAVLLALVGTMAALAYNTATVTNAGEIKIASTNQALLALGTLTDIVGNKDKTAEVVDGDLVFQFGRGNNPSFGGDLNYGLQKNSVYEWWKGGLSNTGMFYIQNRSAESIELSISTSGVPAGVKIEVNQSIGPPGGGWQDVTNRTAILPRGLGSGWTCDVGVRITVDGTAAYDVITPLNVVVSAVAQ